MDWPTTEQLEATIEKLLDELKVMITELDVDVLPPAAPPDQRIWR